MKTAYDRLRDAGFNNVTPEQAAAAERTFAEPSRRDVYLRLRATYPYAAALYGAEHPEVYAPKDGDR